MEDYKAQVIKLVEQARELAHGPARLALVEEAARIADMHQDGDYAFWARGDLVSSGVWGGRPEVAMAAFAARIHHVDQNRDALSESAIFHTLWHYKWIAGDLADYPSMSKAQIEATLVDMSRRYREAGFSQRAVLQKRMWIARDMGEAEEAARCYEAWQAEPRDRMSDCAACEQNARVTYLRWLKRYDEMLEVARPLLEQEIGCEAVPAATFCKVLIPLVDMKRKADARRYHNTGWRMIKKNLAYHIDTWTYHLVYLAYVGSHDEAAVQLGRHAEQALSVFSPANRLDNTRRIATALDLLHQAGVDAISLKLPDTIPFLRDDGRYPTGELAARLRAWVRPVAQALDLRNGNELLTQRLDQPAH